MESVQTKGDAILNEYVKNHKWKLQEPYFKVFPHIKEEIKVYSF